MLAGMLTFLRTDGEPGLQICTDGATWRDVPPLPGAFIVNLGDMLGRWVARLPPWVACPALGRLPPGWQPLGALCPSLPQPETPPHHHHNPTRSWTNGRYRSTLHRVINTTGRERYSMAYFFEPNFDARVEALPQVAASGRLSLGRLVWGQLAAYLALSRQPAVAAGCPQPAIP